MGSSVWSSVSYTSRSEDRRTKGVKTFEYHDNVTSGRIASKIHDSLNILNKIREARDSEAHPESLAIGVVFDVTGSMHTVPAIMQEHLPKLMDMLIQRGWVKDPQILIGAVGDSIADRYSLQMGQFESGIEIEDHLRNLILEGGGGGSLEESYENALYYFAHKTSIDCFEKRNKRGYLFMIGDEKPYPTLQANIYNELISTEGFQEIKVEDIVEELQKKYNVFFIIPKGTANYDKAVVYDRWAGLIGSQNIIKLEDPKKICETIGLTIAVMEGVCNSDGSFIDQIPNAVAEKLKALNEAIKG